MERKLTVCQPVVALTEGAGLKNPTAGGPSGVMGAHEFTV